IDKPVNKTREHRSRHSQQQRIITCPRPEADERLPERDFEPHKCDQAKDPRAEPEIEKFVVRVREAWLLGGMRVVDEIESQIASGVSFEDLLPPTEVGRR